MHGQTNFKFYLICYLLSCYFSKWFSIEDILTVRAVKSPWDKTASLSGVELHSFSVIFYSA